jgi:predicted small lipoprotein YifL
MVALPKSLILPLLALPALIGCGTSKGPDELPPLSEKALVAVAEKPGIPREKLARAVDTLFSQDATAETRAVLVCTMAAPSPNAMAPAITKTPGSSRGRWPRRSPG